VLAQELADPGRAQVLLSLVALEGHELYTCMLSDGRLSGTDETVTVDEPFIALQRRIHEYNGCLILGYFSKAEATGPYSLTPTLNPSPNASPGEITGLVALAPQFQPLEEAVRALLDGDTPHSLKVEFVPNSIEDIVFMQASDKQRYLKYREYWFTLVQ